MHGLQPGRAPRQLSGVAARPGDVREAIGTLASLDAIGIEDPVGLSTQFRLMDNLDNQGYLTAPSVNEAGMPTTVIRSLPSAIRSVMRMVRLVGP